MRASEPAERAMDPAVTFTLTASDGVELFVYAWLPPAPRAVVQIVHGLAEHAARYARLAQALNAAGYAVYAHDLRGHGRTARSTAELGIFALDHGWQKCMGDLLQLNRYIAAAHPGLPVFLLGHSMGATLAEQFMGEHGEMLAGVVLSGGSGEPTSLSSAGRLLTRAERLRLGPEGKSRLAQSLTFDAFNRSFAPTRTAFDWLSRDAAEVDKYVADPLCGFAPSVQLWIDLLNASREIAGPARRERVPKSLPVYAIAGGRDPVSGNTRQLQRWLAQYRAAGLRRLEHRFYPEARHELFNEINRDEVTAHLIEWLDRAQAQA